MATVTVIFGGQEQKTHTLDKPRMVVGREPSCEIHIDNLGISRQHCEFQPRGEAFVVKDLGSSNGTYVNGRKITEHFLNDADEIIIGKYTLKFRNETQQQNAPAAAAPAPAANVPDTLNTYVMDGAKIQEQLAKMRAQGSPDPAVPAGATAKDYAKALDAAAPAPQGNSMKTLVIFLSVMVVILLIVVALVLSGVIKIGGAATGG
jgi:pSer/pThr/pTyr-binding forkhead associated (FHA) protein